MGGAIVETVLNHSIQVWELRNRELHGDKGCSKVRKQRLEMEVRDLQLLKEKPRPQDNFMFVKDIDKYLEKATVSTLTAYLAMTKKAILGSVKKWIKNKEAGVTLVIEWLQIIPGNAEFIKQAEKKTRKHWEDGRKKERRRQHKETVAQRSFVGYLSLVDLL